MRGSEAAINSHHGIFASANKIVIAAIIWSPADAEALLKRGGERDLMQRGIQAQIRPLEKQFCPIRGPKSRPRVRTPSAVEGTGMPAKPPTPTMSTETPQITIPVPQVIVHMSHSSTNIPTEAIDQFAVDVPGPSQKILAMTDLLRCPL